MAQRIQPLSNSTSGLQEKLQNMVLKDHTPQTITPYTVFTNFFSVYGIFHDCIVFIYTYV